MYAIYLSIDLKIRIDFHDFWQKYSKGSRIHVEFACFICHVGLLFINFSSFKPDTENNADFDAVIKQMRQLWRRSVKKTEFWSLYEYKDYTDRQFITEFLNKG